MSVVRAVSSHEQDGCYEDHECDRNMSERQKRPEQRRLRRESKNETKAASRGSWRDKVTITENKCRIMDLFILTEA